MPKMITVTSTNNEAVKFAAKLSSSKRARDEAKLFVAEGRKLVAEALQSGYEAVDLFVTASAGNSYEDIYPRVSGTVYTVTLPVMNKITESKTPQDITAIFAYKSYGFTPDGSRYLCLEKVQEPGNAGALIRSAAAFGFDGVLLSEGCADMYSMKALRGSMGAIFRLPVFVLDDLRGFIVDMQKKGFCAYATALRDDSVSLEKASFSDKLLLLVGNEGNGLEDETVALCDSILRIPMAQGTESLNAAVAGSIVMWEVSEWKKNMQSGFPKE